MVRAALIAASVVVGASGHGDLILPVPRNSDRADHLFDDKPGCLGDACWWYSQGCCCGQSECDNGGQHSCSTDPTDYPAKCPGQAPVIDPCGYWQTLPSVWDRHGSNLPESPPVQWQAGSRQPVQSGIYINHEGVYQYRLCPKSSPLTEACFAEHVLPFADEEEPLAWKSVGSDKTHVANDTVVVPEELGEYVLQWRWDCSKTAQVWTNCADVSVVATPTPPPTPAPTPSACEIAGFERHEESICRGTDCPEGSCLRTGTWSADLCCQACAAYTGFRCNAWTFEESLSHPCVLNAEGAEVTSSPGKTCGIRKSVSLV